MGPTAYTLLRFDAGTRVDVLRYAMRSCTINTQRVRRCSTKDSTLQDETAAVKGAVWLAFDKLSDGLVEGHIIKLSCGQAGRGAHVRPAAAGAALDEDHGGDVGGVVPHHLRPRDAAWLRACRRMQNYTVDQD